MSVLCIILCLTSSENFTLVIIFVASVLSVIISMPEAIEVCKSDCATTSGGGGIGAGARKLIAVGPCVLKLGNATGSGGARNCTLILLYGKDNLTLKKLF